MPIVPVIELGAIYNFSTENITTGAPSVPPTLFDPGLRREADREFSKNVSVMNNSGPSSTVIVLSKNRININASNNEAA